MFRGADWHQAQASTHGRRAKAILLDYILELGEPCAYIVEEIVEQTVKAAHHANVAIEAREISQAAVRMKMANQDAQRVRLMMTPRCNYQRVTDEKLKDGSVQQVAGDPCGGKLKPVTSRRVLLGGECSTCGRFYAVPKDPDPAPVDAIEAEAGA